MLFTGQQDLNIDAKQRLAIPAKYRAQMDPARDGNAWYVVPWPGGVLRLFTEAKFAELAEREEQSLMPGEDAAALEADFFSLAERVEMDSAGRVVLPKGHLELAGLGTEVVVIGAKNRLEVRDRQTWNATLPDRFNKLATRAERNGPTRTT